MYNILRLNVRPEEFSVLVEKLIQKGDGSPETPESGLNPANDAASENPIGPGEWLRLCRSRQLLDPRRRHLPLGFPHQPRPGVPQP